jgi:hypothetical protein
VRELGSASAAAADISTWSAQLVLEAYLLHTLGVEEAGPCVGLELDQHCRLDAVPVERSADTTASHSTANVRDA